MDQIPEKSQHDRKKVAKLCVPTQAPYFSTPKDRKIVKRYALTPDSTSNEPHIREDDRLSVTTRGCKELSEMAIKYSYKMDTSEMRLDYAEQLGYPLPLNLIGPKPSLN